AATGRGAEGERRRRPHGGRGRVGGGWAASGAGANPATRSERPRDIRAPPDGRGNAWAPTLPFGPRAATASLGGSETPWPAATSSTAFAKRWATTTTLSPPWGAGVRPASSGRTTRAAS